MNASLIIFVGSLIDECECDEINFHWVSRVHFRTAYACGIPARFLRQYSRNTDDAQAFIAVPISQMHGSRNGPSRVTIGDPQEPPGRTAMRNIGH